MAATRRLTLAASGMTVGLALVVAAATAPTLAGGPAVAAAAPGGCAATAHIDAQWGAGATGGEVLSFTVTNTSRSAATNWTVAWTLASGQRVLNAWSATVTMSGTAATAVNAPYNGALAPGASTTFGMQLSGVGPLPAPSCANDAAPPSSAPAGGGDVNVGEADNQTTVTLAVGQTLGVSLNANFRPPTASGPALTELSVSGGYGTGQPLSALYRATAAGTVDLSAVTDAACLHATPPCAVPVELWTVHVKVVGASPGGQTVTVTVADNHTTVNLRVGDRLTVSLSHEYDPPTVTPGGVLAQSDSTGGYPTDQPLLVHYLAMVPGQVDISTRTDAPCVHQPTPCPTPTVPWTIHVIVTG